ncbi:MAG: WG repeat-containing protein, partial [Saprospiraceae bacterium]
MLLKRIKVILSIPSLKLFTAVLIEFGSIRNYHSFYLFCLTFYGLFFLPAGLIAQNYYPVKINQKWGLIDRNGELVVAPQYEVIGTPQKFGYTLMQQAGKIGLLDKQGKLLMPANYTEIKILDSNFFEVTIDAEQQVITVDGQIILKGHEYEQLSVLNPELLVFANQGLFGCIHASGKELAAAEYAEITLYKQQYLKVKKGQLYGLLDLTGKLILPVVADAFNVLDNGLIFYLKGVLWGAVTLDGERLIQPNYSAYTSINESLIKLERFGENWLYNIEEQRIVSAKSIRDFL